MRKIIVLLCSIALSTLTFIASAQTEPEEKKYNNDVGFNTTFLFTGILNAGPTPFTLMYKKYRDNNNPIRLGINTNINLSNESNDGQTSYTNTSSANISLVIGKEFQKPINTNWTWYFGGDVIPSFNYSKYETFQNGELTYTNTNKSVGLGFLPFLGIRFNINPRLYLSTEFSFGPSYSYRWILDQYEDPQTTRYDIKGGNFNFSMNRAYGLFFYYRF